MDALKYLQPGNPVAAAVVVALVVGFIVWFLILAWQTKRLIRERERIKRCEDVTGLSEALSNWLNKKEGQPGSEPPARFSFAEADRAFQRFCSGETNAAAKDGARLKEGSVIAAHLRAIFDSGWTGSRLESSDLIKHTLNRLFGVNGLLRSLLASFIVAGLLGTLFGLADSLAHLPVIKSGVSSELNPQLASDLNLLIAALKGAFAPSILGVFFTILGVIFFALYTQFACTPVRSLLERLTLTVWIPKLVPTTTQRMIETLQLSEQQILENRRAMQQVGSLAANIEGKAGALNQSLENANSSLNAMTQSSVHLNDFAKSFVTGVTALTGFQQQLGDLYGQMVKESREFHGNVQVTINRTEEFQMRTQKSLEAQHDQIQSLLAALSAYEKAYVRSREELDKSIKQTLDSATKAYDDIGERNKELVAAVGNPLRRELTEKLGELEGALHLELNGIKTTIGRFDAPLESAASKIAGSLETFDKRTDLLAKELRREILQQDEKNRDQLQHLERLNVHIQALLAELPKTVQFQGEQAQSLSQHLRGVSENFATLGTGIAELGRTLKPAADGVRQFDAVERQIREVKDALQQLSNSSRSQNEQAQALLKSINGVEKEVGRLSSRIGSSGSSRGDAREIGRTTYSSSGPSPSTSRLDPASSTRFAASGEKTESAGYASDGGDHRDRLSHDQESSIRREAAALSGRGAVVTAVDPIRGPSELRTYSTVATKVEPDGEQGRFGRIKKRVSSWFDWSDGDR